MLTAVVVRKGSTTVDTGNPAWPSVAYYTSCINSVVLAFSPNAKQLSTHVPILFSALAACQVCIQRGPSDLEGRPFRFSMVPC